jgi:hypothetical protein
LLLPWHRQLPTSELCVEWKLKVQESKANGLLDLRETATPDQNRLFAVVGFFVCLFACLLVLLLRVFFIDGIVDFKHLPPL